MAKFVEIVAPPENTIYVRGLPWAWDEPKLTYVFEKFGKITRCFVKRPSQLNPTEGYGFVSFKSYESAKNSLQLNKKTVEKMKLKVEIQWNPLSKDVYLDDNLVVCFKGFHKDSNEDDLYICIRNIYELDVKKILITKCRSGNIYGHAVFETLEDKNIFIEKCSSKQLFDNKQLIELVHL